MRTVVGRFDPEVIAYERYPIILSLVMRTRFRFAAHNLVSISVQHLFGITSGTGFTPFDVVESHNHILVCFFFTEQKAPQRSKNVLSRRVGRSDRPCFINLDVLSRPRSKMPRQGSVNVDINQRRRAYLS